MLELSKIRRQYGKSSLEEKNLTPSPLALFQIWIQEATQCELDPTAMTLSTVDTHGRPDSRIVLLKGVEQEKFVFYTHYESNKSKQLQNNPEAALLFYWPHLARQVRIRGPIERTSSAQSDAYFVTRPFESQLSAIASPQSHKIDSREVLEQDISKLRHMHTDAPLKRPTCWGGYQLNPTEIEFWQGCDNRLHDRIHYFLKKGQWHYERLAP